MSTSRRGVVWSLLTAILILLAGVMGLLYISYNRDKQYDSEIRALRYKLTEQEAEIELLQNKLKRSVPPADTSWTKPIRVVSFSATSR
jgi:hypothetical protein